MTRSGDDAGRLGFAGHGPSLVVCVVYAAVLFLLPGGRIDAFRLGEHAVCGDVRHAFAREGRAGLRENHLVQEATGRVIVLSRREFPYRLSSFPTHALDPSVIHAIGVDPREPVLRVVPRVQGQPLEVAETLVRGDRLLLWGSYRERRGDERRHALVAVDPDGAVRVVREDGLLRPLAFDEQTASLISIEERTVILGAQPKELERPPQRLVFEPLDERDRPLAAGTSELPIRRLLTVLSDDRGMVYLARWQGEKVPPYYEYEAYLYLEKYSIPLRQRLWSVQVHSEPMAPDRFARLDLTLGVEGVRVAHERWVAVEAGQRLRTQAHTFDPVDGRRIHEELLAGPLRTARGPRLEIELAGQRAVLVSDAGIGGRCVLLRRPDGELADGAR